MAAQSNPPAAAAATPAWASSTTRHAAGGSPIPSAAFEKDQTGLVVSGLAAGEYEVQARAFVDNRDDSLPEMFSMTAYGNYGETHTVQVP